MLQEIKSFSKWALNLFGLLFIFNLSSGCVSGGFQQAEFYRRQQNLEKARKYLEEYVQDHPRDGAAHLLLAEVYGESDLFRLMNTMLNRATEISPKFEREAEMIRKEYWIKNFNRGVENFRSKNYEEALFRFEMAALIDSTNLKGLQKLADSYYMTARYHEAAKTYEKILQMDENNLTVKNNLAEVYFQLNQYEQAIQLCTEILQKKSDEVNVLMRRAYAYDALDKFDEAERDFLRLVHLKPEERLLKDLGLLYFHHQKYEQAIKWFTQALEKTDDPVSLYRYLGEANRLAKNYLAMAKWYKKIVEVNPNDLTGWKNLAIAYEALGATDDLIWVRSQINRMARAN